MLSHIVVIFFQILYDNTDHNGQMGIHLTLEETALTCKDGHIIYEGISETLNHYHRSLISMSITHGFFMTIQIISLRHFPSCFFMLLCNCVCRGRSRFDEDLVLVAGCYCSSHHWQLIYSVHEISHPWRNAA